jgi:predicted RNA-binding Zn-ribbon protein involved in translation (DUF1610 family)
MAKKPRNNIFSTKPRNNKRMEKTNRWPCPRCGEDDAYKITSLRHGLNYCYNCENEYMTGEDL